MFSKLSKLAVLGLAVLSVYTVNPAGGQSAVLEPEGQVCDDIYGIFPTQDELNKTLEEMDKEADMSEFTQMREEVQANKQEVSKMMETSRKDREDFENEVRSRMQAHESEMSEMEEIVKKQMQESEKAMNEMLARAKA